MPIITIRYAALDTGFDRQDEIAEAALEASTAILGKRRELTAVVLSRVAPADWYVAGKSLAAHGLSSFQLDIKVVDGTNTKDEKARFIEAMFRRMGELLGALHEESYVYVEEVFADAYGYGGLTQERRYIAGNLGVPPHAVPA
ncbi:MAG TPA: 4-oxalocrotonate tautomerase [Azospirillaceae bacterium]|nr:4-oxalocrotonate tautomerase [Azospirillaceae bacterium]